MIVVTGSAGFIASYLVDHLNALGLTNLVLVDDFTKIDKEENWKNTQFSSNYITINNIQSSTTYDFYVRAVCSSYAPNDTSNFVKYTYTTIGSCPAPHNLSSYVISGSCNAGLGATRAMSWSYDYGTPSSYTVSIVTQGDQPSATSNAFTVSNNGITISGMYCLWTAFYVRANCQNGESSSWAGPYYF